jgi:hypothetical protein
VVFDDPLRQNSGALGSKTPDGRAIARVPSSGGFMSADDSNAHGRPLVSSPSKNARHGLVCVFLSGVLGLSALWSCGSSSSGTDTGDGGGVTTGGIGTTTGGVTTGTTGGITTGTIGVTTSTTGGVTTGATAGVTTGDATTGGVTTGTTGDATTGTTGTTGGVTTGTTGSVDSGIQDASVDRTMTADAAPACTNTNMASINIDSSGWACNNQWGIQGAWYCYQDPSIPVIAGGCAGTGVIPFNATSNAMCISGVTSNAAASTTVYGAGIGLVLNQPEHGSDAGKDAFNATAKNIVGFAITISGDSGGSVLNINLPPALTTSGESAAITVPGVTSATSPVTYNVMIADAIVSDNASSPIPKIDATKLTDVQVAIPSGDKISHTYDFCVTKIVPLMAAATAPGNVTNYGPTFNEGKQIVIEGMGPYGLQNDPFNVGGDQMTMQAQYGGGKAGFTVTPLSGFSSSNTSPGAFPSIVSGWITGGNVVSTAEGGYAGNGTITSGPKPLSSVTSSWSYTPGGGSWDAAYDCWLSSPGFPDPIKAGYELMVWLGHNTANPIGAPGSAVTISGTNAPSGTTWTVSTGTNGTGQPVVSYLAGSNITSVSNFNLLPFFVNATSHGIPAGAYLLSVQAGFELYNTGTWTTTSYNITIQ